MPTQYRNGAALPADAVQPAPSAAAAAEIEEVEATFGADGDAVSPPRRPPSSSRAWAARFQDDGVDAAAPARPSSGAAPRGTAAATRLFVDRTRRISASSSTTGGVATAPADDDAKAELLLELEFYGMQSFAGALRAVLARAARRPSPPRWRTAPTSGACATSSRRATPGRSGGSTGTRASWTSPISHPRGVAFAAPPAVDAKSTLLYDARWSPSRRSAARAHRRRVIY